jgi:hypothetical protein
MYMRQSSGIFPRIGFALLVVRLWCEGTRRAVSSHVLIEGEEVKEQVDNKGCCLISCNILTVLAIDSGLALICFFESKPNFHSASPSFLGIVTWLFGLLEGVSFAEWVCCWSGNCIVKALLRLSVRCLPCSPHYVGPSFLLNVPFLCSFACQVWHLFFLLVIIQPLDKNVTTLGLKRASCPIIVVF